MLASRIQGQRGTLGSVGSELFNGGNGHNSCRGKSRSIQAISELADCQSCGRFSLFAGCMELLGRATMVLVLLRLRLLLLLLLNRSFCVLMPVWRFEIQREKMSRSDQTDPTGPAGGPDGQPASRLSDPFG